MKRIARIDEIEVDGSEVFIGYPKTGGFAPVSHAKSPVFLIIGAGAAVVAIGAVPYIRYSGVEHGERGIRVNGSLQTDDPDILAAGDVSQSPAGHWVTAMRQGRAAAAAMLGHTDVGSDVPFFWTDLGEETLRVVGHRVVSDGEIRVKRGDITGGEFLAVWKSGGAVTGAFSVGFDKELIDVEQTLRVTAGLEW